MPSFRPIQLMKGVQQHEDYKLAWNWGDTLSALLEKCGDSPLDDVVVPATAFKEHVLRAHLEHIEGVLLEVEVRDYKKVMEADLRSFWLARVQKVAGYRVLLRWLGADLAGDEKYEFWMNIGSVEVSGIGIRERSGITCYIPPAFLEARWREGGDFKLAVSTTLSKCSPGRSLGKNFETDRKKVYSGCKIKVGQRVELLDYNQSTRVRPARVRSVTGRRMCVQVLKADCDTHESDDRQYGADAEFWVDQESFFIFHVGWALLNGYGLESKKDYRKHAQKVADAIKAGETPPYATTDVTKEQMADWRTDNQTGEKWAKGMKFELMDPLGATIRDLYAASVLEVLDDGYLRVGMDGPDAEDECIPLHCTSHMLFPIGYAAKHGLELHGPEDTEDFCWDDYLKQSKSVAAPTHLFKPEPSPDRLAMFKPGAKLEASDMCENVLICAATVVNVKGRLVHVHFDGWEDTFDQFFDVDSNDIFPVGWCELHGYKLEAPKEENPKEPPKKKKK